MTRIAFVGAGSVEFTRDLLGDILSFPELADATIALHDIDPERLATGEAMARWTNQALGARATIEAHLDRRAALEGCDHVINMIQVGGHQATLIDFEIPKRHGLRQTIGDTLGIGGIFRSLRTIPVMLGIAAQFKVTKGRSRRELIWCTARATSSFPVPVSPSTNTVALVGATSSI